MKLWSPPISSLFFPCPCHPGMLGGCIPFKGIAKSYYSRLVWSIEGIVTPEDVESFKSCANHKGKDGIFLLPDEKPTNRSSQHTIQGDILFPAIKFAD